MSFGTWLFTKRFGKLVGKDGFGNSYYEHSGGRTDRWGRKMRWVVYKGKVEGSKVPAAWHAWLHHTSDKPLEDPGVTWVQTHQPNLTGTLGAYVPGGDERAGGKRAASSGDYEAWRP